MTKEEKLDLVQIKSGNALYLNDLDSMKSALWEILELTGFDTENEDPILRKEP